MMPIASTLREMAVQINSADPLFYTEDLIVKALVECRSLSYTAEFFNEHGLHMTVNLRDDDCLIFHMKKDGQLKRLCELVHTVAKVMIEKYKFEADAIGCLNMIMSGLVFVRDKCTVEG